MIEENINEREEAMDEPLVGQISLDDLLEDKQFGLGGSQLLFDGPTKEEIVPKFLEECAFDGHHYAVPYMRSTEACYINADFVGQIMPSNTNGTICYQFKPGPFTKILRRAYLNPSKKYFDFSSKFTCILYDYVV